MSTDEPNPYSPSGVDPKPHAEPVRGRMEYMRAVNYVFESPNWIPNLLFGGLCLLSTAAIPIVGNLIWLGYQFEIIEALIGKPSARYPDFTFNRFVEYLTRGLWLLLVGLVVGIAIAPIGLLFVFGIMGCFGGLAAVTGGDDDALAVGMLILVPIVILIGIAFWFLLIVVITPFMIRAGLSQDFGESFNFAWAKDFARKMWKEIILATLFTIAVALACEVIGLLLLCIGIYPAIAYAMLVQGHLYLQLYELYLARGGEKIPLKPAPTPPGQTA